MKFTLEIELDGENLTFGMVRDALDYDDNWPKPDGSIPALNVVDVNGNAVGKWEVTEPAKTQGHAFDCESVRSAGKRCTCDTTGRVSGFTPITAKTQPMLTLRQSAMLAQMRDAEPTRFYSDNDLIASFTDEEREEFNDYGGYPERDKTIAKLVALDDDGGVSAEPIGVAREDFEGPMSPQDI